MTVVKFSGIMEIRGINPYVLVSRARAEQLKDGWRKPLPVIVRVNGQPAEAWHINMMPAGDGDFYLYLHAIVRKASGTKVGDAVAIELAFDSDYRGGPASLPERFRAALADSPVALANWEKLSPSRQKEVTRYLANVKSPAVQAQNVERAIRVLSGADERFMARAWHNGA